MIIKDICNGSTSNGFLKGGSINSRGGDGSGSLKIRTYKRRKVGINGSSSSLVDSDKVSPKPSSLIVKELVEDFEKNSCAQVCDQKVNCHSLLNGSDDCCFQQRCFRDALIIPCTNEAKEISDSHDGQKRNSNVSSSAVERLSSTESVHPTDSKMCQQVYFRILASEGFSSLRKLVSANFNGLHIEKVLDFSVVNTRLKEGAYERSPTLFASDIQQIWRRLHSISSEMVSLANNLSDLSRAFCRDMGGTAELDTSSDGKHELSARDSDIRSKWEEPSTSVFCTCRQCGEKSNGRDWLMCNSCEETFHVSCIQPDVMQIPHKSWYCANCTTVGIDTPHEGCAACERLNAMSYDEPIDEVEESSDDTIETGVQVFNGTKRLSCKVCGCMFSNGEEYRACEHRFCQYKYYHIRCLTNKQLKSYGPRWYCPSCLCRVCLTDKDDDDLVMCDGCDHGYHIYCMNPPLTSIPEGKWFCNKCDIGVQAICRARKLHGNHEKTEGDDFEEMVGGPEGMDMLLTAAKTLNEEELGTSNGM